MGVGVLVGFILLVFILLSAPVLFYILNRKGHKKSAWLISITIILFCFSFFFTNKIASLSFTKTDAIADLKLAKVELTDDFKIISNEVEGMPERFQTTVLEISKNDAKKLIKEIRSGKEFKTRKEDFIFWNERRNGVKNQIVTTDYKFYDEYIRESYYKEDEYIPTIMIVRLKLNSDTLIFERIEN